MRQLLLAIIGLVLLGPAGIAGAPARVAAWNIASGRSDTGGTPIPADRIDRLAEVIATKIKPDVLVLEEVWPADAAAAIAAAATKKGFELVPVKIPAQNASVVQLIGILKRPEVQVTDIELIDKSNDVAEGDDPEEKTTRKAVLAKVKIDHFDFYLVGVHLKSKKPSKTITASPLEMRDRQCKAIADRLHDLTSKGTEKDVVIAGDYNMTPAGQEDEGEPSDAKNFETLDGHHEFRFLSSEDKAPSHVGFYKGHIRRSKLDGFAIGHATEKEYVADSFHILDFKALGAEEKQFTNTRFPTFLSDHFPIVADFDASKDDD